ncbi:hypothetical protein [Sphingomonas sp. Leaf23]|nr:hypothetical protein [Sphingomonas sp. Leaf23]
MSPLTRFIVDMLAGKLPSRDPAALAQGYGIRADHARDYLNAWRNR